MYPGVPAVPGCRVTPAWIVGSSAARRRLARLADAEVHDLRAAIFGQHDVARLQIAVHDARGVSGRQAVGDLAGDVDHAERTSSAPQVARHAATDRRRIP